MNPAPGTVEGVLLLERTLDLFDRTIGGVGYWPLLRASLVRRAPVAGETTPSRAGRWAGAFAADLRALRFPDWSPANALVLPLHRKVRRGDRIDDRFLEPVLAEARFGPFLALESSIATEHLTPSPNLAVTLQERDATAASIRGAARVASLLGEARREHALIDAAHRRLFGSALTLSATRMAARAAHFHERSSMLGRRLARTGATRLFATYSDPALFFAANRLGIETIQIQHGALSAGNLSMHFPGRPQVASFPSRYWVFGEYWREAVSFPANCRAQVTGSLVAALPAPQAKEPRTALVLSQPPTDERLLRAAAQAARDAPDWRFIFRPHPREDFQAYEARLADLAPGAGFRLSPSDEDIYALLARCEVQIGVASTALFEGMALGARTIVLDLPGCDVMEEVIRSGDAVLARPGEDLARMLETAPAARRGEAYFAPPLEPGALWDLCASG